MTYQHPSLVALDQVEDLLDAYADARLAPRKPVLARMRAAVMAEAERAAAGRAAEDRQAAAAALIAADAEPARRFGLPRFTLRMLARPAFALGFAGLLAIGTGTAITAASPGTPLYLARVGLEQVFLPTQLDARFAAHEDHLNERLAEAEAAAAGGDGDALAAALDAYQDEVDATLADIGDDYGRLEHFQAVLESHVAKLTALSLSLPTDVASGNAEVHAIQASESAVTKTTAAVAKAQDKKVHAHDKPATPPAQDNSPSRPSPPAVQPNTPDGRP